MEIIAPEFDTEEALARRQATNAKRLGSLASIDLGI